MFTMFIDNHGQEDHIVPEESEEDSGMFQLFSQILPVFETMLL